jgi:hypothetical protein
VADVKVRGGEPASVDAAQVPFVAEESTLRGLRLLERVVLLFAGATPPAVATSFPSPAAHDRYRTERRFPFPIVERSVLGRMATAPHAGTGQPGKSLT